MVRYLAVVKYPADLQLVPVAYVSSIARVIGHAKHPSPTVRRCEWPHEGEGFRSLQIIAGAARELVYTDEADSSQSESTVTAHGQQATYNPHRFRDRFENHPTCECFEGMTEHKLIYSRKCRLGESLSRMATLS